MDSPDKKRKVPPQKSSPVKSRKPRILIFLAAGLAGILIIIMAVVFSIDPNNFREPVVQILTRATGLNISIEYMDWSFSQGLQFKAKGLQIHSADQAKELLSTDELLLKIKVWPLLQKKVVVDRITLIKPVIRIPLNPETETRQVTKFPPGPEAEPNISGEPGAPAPDPSPSSSAKNNDPSPEWLQALREFLKNPNFTLAEIDLIAGQVIFQDEGAKKELPLDIGVQVRIIREENRVGLSLNNLEFGTGNLVVTGAVRADDLLSSNSALQATLDFKPFKTADILSVLDWVPQARNTLIEEMQLKGNFDQLTLKFSSPVEALTDLESVSRNANLDLTLKAVGLSMIQSGKLISLPTFEAVAQWKSQELKHKISWSVLAGNFSVEGKYFKEDPMGSIADGTLDTQLTFEKVDFREIKNMLPVSLPWFPETGVMDGTVHLQGPVMRPEALRLKAKFKVAETTLQVEGKKVVVSSIDGQAEWHNGRLTHKVGVKVFGGEIRVQGKLDVNKNDQGVRDPVIDLDVITQSIRLAAIKPLVQNEWFPEKGRLTGTVHLQGSLEHPEAMKGQGKLKFSDVEVKTKTRMVRLPMVEVEGKWSNNKLVHNIRGDIFGGKIQVKGQLNLGKGNGDPVVDSEVVFTGLRLADLRPWVPQDAFPETGVIGGTVHLQGPVMRPEALRVKAKFKVPKTASLVEGKRVAFSNLDGQGEWHNGRLTHKVGVNIFGGKVRVQGKLDLKKDDQGVSDPVVDSEVVFTALRLADLRPWVPQEGFPESGVIGGTVHLQGPVKRFSEIDMAGKISGQKIVLKTNDKPVTVKKVSVSVGPKSKAGQSVDFDLSNIRVAEIDLKNISGNGFLSETTFNLKRGKISPKNGAIFLKGTYNLKTTSYNFDVLGENLRLEEFPQKYIRGPLGFRGNFFGSLSSDDFKKELSGSLKFNSEKGDILAASPVLGEILTVLNFQTPSNTQGARGGVLPYSYLGANCIIRKGVLSTEDFKMDSSIIKLLVSGKADSVSETLDAEVKVTPLKSIGKALGNLEALAKKSLSTAGKDTVKRIPLVGDILTGDGKEGQLLDNVLDEIFQSKKGGLFGKIFKKFPSLGGKTSGSEKNGGLLDVYFGVDGTFDEPRVNFLPQKTFLSR